MHLSKRALGRALALGAVAGWPGLACAAADGGVTVDSVVVTARRNPEDPPVVAEIRRRLSETPGAVAVVSAESYARRYAPNLADMLFGGVSWRF